MKSTVSWKILTLLFLTFPAPERSEVGTMSVFYILRSIQKMSLKGERKTKHIFSKGFTNLLRKNLQFKKKCARFMYFEFSTKSKSKSPELQNVSRKLTA